MKKKHKIFPFKIGCTSYVLPDDIIPNVSFMADKADDIELVLFESKDQSNIPDKNVVSSLSRIAGDNSLSYSIHLPIDQKVAAKDKTERALFFTFVTRVIERVHMLPVSGYVLHFEGISKQDTISDYQRWHSCVTQFCDKLVTEYGKDLTRFTVENLSYPVDYNEEIIKKYSFSRCIDVGHLWRQHTDWEPYLKTHLKNTPLIHLHGVTKENKDHVSLRNHHQKEDLELLLLALKNFNGVVTIEVFNYQDFAQSLTVMRNICQKLY